MILSWFFVSDLLWAAIIGALIFAIFKIYSVFFHHTRFKSNVCLVGKTALVTGGNRGIGYEIVLSLLSRGCRVIIVDVAQRPELLTDIQKETHNSNFAFKQADLASFKSIRELSKDLAKNEEKLDILIHNAGIASDLDIKTEDGLNKTLQVNYFGAFLLTHLLVGLLNKSSRIIFTSSILSFTYMPSVDVLKSKMVSHNNRYLSAYGHSKLCLLLAAEIFAKKLKPYEISCYTYHPGAVYTRIFRDCRKTSSKSLITWFYVYLMESIVFLLGKTPTQAAETPVYLSISNEVKNDTGKFYCNLKPTLKPFNTERNQKLVKDLWNLSEDLVKLNPDEIL